MNPSSYANLPPRFFAKLDPTPVREPRVIRFNRELAGELDPDLADLNAAAVVELFSGNAVPAGMVPIAMAYAGHQFGHFVPQLGDGRAILLAESCDRA
ncbi:MAG TPA: protein adenylyltransferase SelO family protein, partial [Steroidobacteraceae bacterium]|nr:protein adenylyltransferase SelO family protein [Steroidobacteraceae bacterium]